MNPPSVNLQPGQTSAEVKQLQQWLISQGYSIPDGPTTFFGPQTQAALTKWQQDHGVDTAGNAGFYGPRTIAAIQQQPTTSNTSQYPSFSSQAAGTGLRNNFNGVTNTATTTPATLPQAPIATIPAKTATPLAQSTTATTTPQGSSASSTIPSPASSSKPYGSYSNSPATASNGQPTQSTTSNQGLTQDQMDALSYLFTPDQIAAMSPSDQQNWALMSAYLKKQSDLGQTQSNISAQTLQDAYTKALADPDIANKYGDIQKIDQSNFANNLAATQQNIDLTTQQQHTDFANQQKDLAEKYASMGAAESGFRNQAKKELDQNQSGIVQSSLAQLKQNLRGDVTNLQKYYGSNQFNTLFGNPSLNYTNPMTGATQSVTAPGIPGLTGTEAAAKNADVLNRTSQINSLMTTPQ